MTRKAGDIRAFLTHRNGVERNEIEHRARIDATAGMVTSAELLDDGVVGGGYVADSLQRGLTHGFYGPEIEALREIARDMPMGRETIATRDAILAVIEGMENAIEVVEPDDDSDN